MTDLSPLARERAIIASTTIEVLRCYSRAYFHTDQIGANTEDILIGCAIIVGQVRGNPLSASDIAEYVGLPRATVVRRLQIREKHRLIISAKDGRRIKYTIRDTSDPHVTAQMEQMIFRVKRGIRELSKLDTSGV